MDTKRKVAMVAATLAVALGAGHLMQNGIGGGADQVAKAQAPAEAQVPKEITPLAAGVEPAFEYKAAGATNTPLPDVAFSSTPTEAVEAESTPIKQAETPSLPAFGASELDKAESGQNPDGDALAAGGFDKPEALSTEFATPALPDPTIANNAATPGATMAAAGDKCAVSFDVVAATQATLDLTLVAPCRASERVVLRHGGLTVSAMTSPTGALFTSLPGMELAGEVSVNFSDGQEVSAAAALPDLPLYRRFAVQWVDGDRFQLQAYENGASFGEEGHVSAATPKRRLPNVPMDSGYLSVLGDSNAPLPMLAEVYTFPMNTAETVSLAIEATVTDATCNRELLGEVLFSEGGSLTKSDLTMAMPTCDAIGDVLVLNNPLPDLKLAAAN